MGGQVPQLAALTKRSMAIHSPAKCLLTRLAPLCLLVGAEVAQAQPPAVDDVHVFLSSNNTFELAEPIWVIVYFDRTVTVSGAPLLALAIGTQTRHAAFVGMALTSRPALLFRYTVVPSDYDADGISIGADALSGGAIRAPDGTNAMLDLGSHAIADDPFRTVDGRRETAPEVSGLHISPPPTGDTFQLAETISVWVWFNRAVAVTGAPQLALTIGTETRYASFAETIAAMPVPVASSPALAAEPINFRYAVEPSDHDPDGISIDANALTPGGGAIKIRGGTTDAVLGFASYHAISDSRRHKVDGRRAGEQTVNEAPRAVGELADLEIDVGETAVVEAAAVFEDANGDQLRYSAQSEGGIVALAASKGTVQVRGVRPGEATVFVTAEDPAGLTATASFRVAVGALLRAQGGRPAAPEGGTVVFALALSRPLPAPIATRWRLAADDDAATPDADARDFVATSGQVSIPAGETAATVEVAIAEDADIEPAREHFVLRLEPPDDANVALAQDSSAEAVIQEGVCDRTPAVRDELYPHRQGCHWPNPAALATVPMLDLSRRNIDVLRPNDLLGLDGLRQLDLSANALEALPAGLFAGLRGLREVSVEANPGAPFTLTIELERLDAAPWSPGPAQVVARTAWAAPFGLAAGLAASPAGTATHALPATVRIGAGEAMGEPFAAAAHNGAALVLRADAAALATARCEDRLCFRGFATAPGPTLTLFRQPPRALAPPTLEPLQGGHALRLPLAALVEAEDPPRNLRWEATSSDEALATVRIVNGALEVTPELASAGTAEIALVVTDTAGLSTTLRFDVRVVFHWPHGPSAGWRSALGRVLPR